MKTLTSRRPLLLALFFAPLLAPTSCSRAAAPPDFSRAETLVREAVAEGVPGAVLVIGRRDGVLVSRAFGHASLRPAEKPATLSTIYDLASVTKPVATSTAAMLLVEDGKLELDTTASKYLPAWAEAVRGTDRAKVTIRHLFTHTAGLAPGGSYWGKEISTAQIVQDIAASRPRSKPGEALLYSDFSFLLLGAIVEAVAQKPLDEFLRERVWGRLAMRDTDFLPRAEVLARLASTLGGAEAARPEADSPRRNVVHDPSARAIGGVAGNAGLFSTGDDLARFCRMMLNNGELDGARVMKPETIALWTSPQPPLTPLRALGWDLSSSYSIRGSLSERSFGHTGFTGTSIWIDPANDIFIILLSNAVHAQPARRVVALRRAVSTAVAEALGVPVAAPQPQQ